MERVDVVLLMAVLGLIPLYALAIYLHFSRNKKQSVKNE